MAATRPALRWLAIGPALALTAAGVGAGEADLYDPAVVRTYDLTFQAPDWESALRAAGDVGHARARLEVDGIVAEDIGGRYKGLSSMLVASRKKPLNLTIDAFVPRQRMRGYDVVNLNNGYSDPSFVREALMTEMLRPFLPTQQTAYARVNVNGQTLGAYLAVEQVEGTYLSRWFPDDDGILIKCDPPAGPGMGARTFHSALEWEGENLEAYRLLYEVKTAGVDVEGLTVIREASRILDAPVQAGGLTDAELPAAAAALLDVDGALWYLAANNLFVNYDSYYFGHNYFLYRSDRDQRLHMLLWDTSLSFGGLDLGPWGGAGAGARVDPFALERSAERPVLRRLLAVPEWRADFAAHYRVLLARAFDPDLLEQRGEQLQALVRPVLADDPNRLFSLDLFDRNLRQDVTSRTNMGPGGAAPGIVKFARERSAWLRSHSALAEPDHVLVGHAREPDLPRPDQAARLKLRFAGADVPTAVRLVYRVDGGAPATVETAREGDAWVGTIPGQPPSSRVTYYARVALPRGRSAFHPEANLMQPWSYRIAAPDLPVVGGGPLVVNELMADNATTVADEAGEYDDWLEIYNRSEAPVDLRGWWLGQAADEPWQFALPDATLAPGAYYLVWCDNDPEQGANHAPFRLARGGEEVRLSTRDATFDVVIWDALATDVSLARVPDGAEQWLTCRSPSPAGPNVCTEAPTPSPAATGAPTATAGPTPTVDAPSRIALFLPAAFSTTVP